MTSFFHIIKGIFTAVILLSATSITTVESANSNAYNLNTANISVWLSSAAYCEKENYKTMQLSGPAAGFIVGDILYDSINDVQGFSGVLPSTKTIYVAFRGSSSILNWLADFKVLKEPYTTYPKCNCEVHKGFYNTALYFKDDVIKSVTSLHNKYNYNTVVITGHSLGAAISQLMIMELYAINLQKTLGVNIEMYNFGQPRTGDALYASFANAIVMQNFWRFTHNKDIVPHIPPETGMEYYHSCGEVFEDQASQLKICSNIDCEDPTCADQYSIKETNGDDHSIYLGHFMSCKSSTV